jgi:predicted RNA-binding Zn ribbon-like protein
MVRSEFLFVAAAPVLDFLNTEIMSEGAPADLLAGGDDLVRWLAESGVADRTGLQELRAASGAQRESWFREAVKLRGALRALFTRLAGGQRLRDADLEPLNDALAKAGGQMRVERADESASFDFVPRAVTPSFLIARAAATFLASADLSFVRQCQGEGCILFFHDTTKSHTRRWCSMAVCGNRTKVKAHYERKRS